MHICDNGTIYLEYATRIWQPDRFQTVAEQEDLCHCGISQDRGQIYNVCFQLCTEQKDNFGSSRQVLRFSYNIPGCRKGSCAWLPFQPFVLLHIPMFSKAWHHQHCHHSANPAHKMSYPGDSSYAWATSVFTGVDGCNQWLHAIITHWN